MDFIHLSEQDKNNVARLANQPWKNLSEVDKDMILILSGKGFLGPSVIKDDVIYVGHSLLPQEA